MKHYLQETHLTLQPLFPLTGNKNIPLPEMRSITPNHLYAGLVLLLSLVVCTTPSIGQTKKAEQSLEAAIYTLPDNPFYVYIRLDNPQRKMISVSLLSQNNDNLFTDWTRKYKYNLKLNLTDLNNGDYWVRVTDQRKAITKLISIRTLYREKTQRIVDLSDVASNYKE